MAVVETRKLTKVFGGGREAVREVDLLTADGELLVLLGPSGCGKSTLLRMIAGLEEPTGGDVLIGGKVVTGLPPRARGVAMVFQSYALYPHMTVEGNIAFPLEAQGVPRERRPERVRRAAGLLGIEHLLARRPRELSGGERQRVALARALVREPAVFLLDEPLSNLDAKLRAVAREELTRFHERVGTTTIYVTHDQVEAMSMGDRIVVLEGGAVRQLGTPREVYDAPADVFVATFVGSPPMNLVEDGEGLVGFRPESLVPAAGAPPDALPLRLRVTLAEYLGAERLVHGVVEGGRLDGRRLVARAPAGATELAAGTVHPFAVARAAVHRFDPRSGRRLGPGDIAWR